MDKVRNLLYEVVLELGLMIIRYFDGVLFALNRVGSINLVAMQSITFYLNR